MPKLSETPLVHPSAEIEDSHLGRYTEVAERCRVHETRLGDYSYVMQDCGIWASEIGKFVNVAAAVRIQITAPTPTPTLVSFISSRQPKSIFSYAHFSPVEQFCHVVGCPQAGELLVLWWSLLWDGKCG